MAVEYLNTRGITETAKAIRDKISDFDQCVTDMKAQTNNVLSNWAGLGRNQFEIQMKLVTSQLDDISEGLYDIYNALTEAEAAYIDEDQAVAKQFSIDQAK